MKEQEENNKLIINSQFASDTHKLWLSKSTEETLPLLYEKLQYHTSWDWLMPVVEKIEGLGHKVIMFSDETWIEEVYETDEPLKRNIEIVGINRLANTYAAVIQFITWYNSVNKTQE